MLVGHDVEMLGTIRSKMPGLACHLAGGRDWCDGRYDCTPRGAELYMNIMHCAADARPFFHIPYSHVLYIAYAQHCC